MSTQNEKANAQESSGAEITDKPVQHPSEVPGMLPVGTDVTIVNTVLEGKVDRYHMSTDGKSITYIVAYKGHDGENHEGSFTHQQLKPKA